MKTFHLTIASVGQNLYDAEAMSATLPGKDGVFQILADHEPLVSQLAKGTIRVADANGGQQAFEIEEGGVAEVSGGQATILL